jgi:hypothetical protein
MSNSETPLSHEAAAQELVNRILAAVAERLPVLPALSNADRRRMISVASIPDSFLESVASSTETTPEIGLPNQFTAADVRDFLAFSRNYLPAADVLAEVLRGMRDTVLVRRYEIVQKALGVYATAKSVQRPNRQIVPNLTTMRRSLNRGRRKKQPVPPNGATPAPSPAETTTAKK